MRVLRVLIGAALVPAAIAALWLAGVVDPPEGVRIRLAAYAAVYPGPITTAAVESLPCAPLRRVHFYVVCTEDCGRVWKIVAVKGLRAETIANLNRIPREKRGESRRRFNRVVAGEALRLDATGAREMAGCLMRLDGTRTAFLVEEAALEAIEAAREDESSLRRLAATLGESDALSRITIEESERGFEARAYYLNTDRDGWPVQELRIAIALDGEVLEVKRRVVSEGGPAPAEPDGETPRE